MPECIFSDLLHSAPRIRGKGQLTASQLKLFDCTVSVPRAAQPWTRLSGWRTQLAHAETPSEGTPKLPVAPCPEHPQPSHPQRFPFYIQPSQHMSSNSPWVEKGTLSEQRQAALEKLLHGKLSYPDWERSTPGGRSPNMYTADLADASVETQHVADRLRPKRGIVDECCKRPCSLDTLMSYCNNN